jgi:hypothetical protein
VLFDNQHLDDKLITSQTKGDEESSDGQVDDGGPLDEEGRPPFEPVGASLNCLIEDTLIHNILRLPKVKKNLLECTRQCNAYSQAHNSPKKQSSRLLNAIGLNPDGGPLPARVPKPNALGADPNIIYFEVECGGSKSGGARDIVELKVNHSCPLFLNLRNQTNFHLQYSAYTGLISCLNDPPHLNRGTTYRGGSVTEQYRI